MYLLEPGRRPELNPTPAGDTVKPQATETALVTAPAQASYGQILKSSVLIGGSSLFNVASGIIRSKATALLLGPAGFGLMGLYTSIASLAQQIAAMGINSSGVRQIAAAVGSGDAPLIAQTAAVLRWASVGLGLLGGLVLLAAAGPVSGLTFNSREQTASVALLSLAVFFRVVSDGQGALLQGLRRISELARMGVLNGLFGTITTIVLVYLFREQGVVPSLIAIAVIAAFFSWWFSRKFKFETPPASVSWVVQESGGLLKLGFAFMASGTLLMGAAYVVRLIIARQISLAAVGLYQSAWTIGGLYVGFILDAMGTDFYPRLTGAVANDEECNRLVNEQTQIGLLLAGPGVLATVTLAPLVIPLFYSSAFRDAVGLLRWLCLGVTLRVITWPIGFVIVAKARQSIFLFVEVAYAVFYLALAWLCVGYLGVDGAGVAFLGSYLFHGLVVYLVVRSLSGFRWSAANERLIWAFVGVVGSVFAGFYVLPPWLASTVGLLAVVLSSLYSLRTLVRLVSIDRLPAPVRRLIGWLGPLAV